MVYVSVCVCLSIDHAMRPIQVERIEVPCGRCTGGQTSKNLGKYGKLKLYKNSSYH